MRRLLIAVLICGWCLGMTSVSTAGTYLGSFENKAFKGTGGQDSPIEVVIAAILAAKMEAGDPVPDLTGLTFLFKDDRDDNVQSGPADDAFSVTYTGTHFSGSVAQSPDSFGEFIPLFYSAKIDGPINAGFNLYEWGGASNLFGSEFLKDSQNGLLYTWNDGSKDHVNNWAYSFDSATAQVVEYGVSHVTVWGVVNDLSGGPGLATPEPGALVVWSLIGVLGLGWQMRRQTRSQGKA